MHLMTERRILTMVLFRWAAVHNAAGGAPGQEREDVDDACQAIWGYLVGIRTDGATL
jgi:hypothetical protein